MSNSPVENAIWLMLKEFINNSEMFKSETDVVLNYYFWLTKGNNKIRERLRAEYPAEKKNKAGRQGRHDLVILSKKNTRDSKPEAILEFKYIPDKGGRGKTIREALKKRRIQDLDKLKEAKGKQKYFILFSYKNFNDNTIDNYVKALNKYKNNNLSSIVVFWISEEQKRIYITGRWQFPKEIVKICKEKDIQINKLT